MNKIEYSILKYRYSFHLGEMINIGILFLNHETKQLKFIHPNSLSRVTHLYGYESTIFLRKYIRSFEQQVERLNKKIAPFKDNIGALFNNNNLDYIINKYFLVPDASSVIFSSSKAIPLIDSNVDYEIYKELFPFDLLENEIIEVKRNEEYISNQFKNNISQKITKADFEKHFEHNIELSTELLTERFEYGWQNGTKNLVTPISFDLSQSTRIKDKSLRWTASLNLLKNKAENEGFKFDLLISQPDRPNKEITDQIHKAIERLKSVNNNILSIHIGEKKHSKYVQYTLENLHI